MIFYKQLECQTFPPSACQDPWRTAHPQPQLLSNPSRASILRGSTLKRWALSFLPPALLRSHPLAQEHHGPIAIHVDGVL